MIRAVHGCRFAYVPVLVTVLLAAALAVPGRAIGASGKRVAVDVPGKEGALVEREIEQALKGHGLVPVSSGQVDAAARALRIGAESDAHLAAIARHLKVAAIIKGEVRDRGTRVHVKAHGADGTVIGEGAWSVPGGGHKLAAAVGHSIWSRMGAALEGTSGSAPARRTRPEPVSTMAAAPPAPKPAARPPIALEPTPPPREPTPSADAEGSEFGDTPVAPRTRGPVGSLEREGGAFGGGAGPAALDVAVGPRLVSRDLSWHKLVLGTLTPISVGNAPAIGFQGAWYPAAHFTRGWATYLGVAVSGEYTPSATVQTGGGASYPTSASDYWGGVRVRMPFDGWDGSLTAAYGQHAFLIRSGTDAPRADLAAPDVSYSYLRVGADARVRLPGRFALMAGLAYRDVLSAGTAEGTGAQSQAFFPKATLTAIDANLALGFRINPLIEARVGADLRRYGFDMHPEATDMRVVSGAIDQYLAYWLDLAILLDGDPQRVPKPPRDGL